MLNKLGKIRLLLVKSCLSAKPLKMFRHSFGYRLKNQPFVILLPIFLASESLFLADCVMDDLETECSEPARSRSEAPLPVTSFRTDGLTRAEFCLRFAKETSCNQVMFGSTYEFSNCNNATDNEIRAHAWGHFIDKTYIDFNCPSKGREHMKAITTAISGISQKRALTLALYDSTDNRATALHYEVVEPVRSQVIQLSALYCKTPNTTAKVYAMGIMPNLLCFQLGWYCHGLVIRKIDFSRMPHVRAIQFIISTTIAEMEPYTFTDLSNLQILTLEDQIAGDLYSRGENDHGMAKGFLPDHVFEHIRRLHCDCSFSWLRNFLKKKPYLIMAMKKSQLMKVGSFELPEDDIRAPGSSANVTSLSRRELDNFHITMDIIQNKWSPVLSVNCAQAFNWKNTQAGSQFSYNTSCYNLNC
ncbi:uncharacterized protein LOC129595872 [Paramacrobiotus metropolitanus]|uniref:uncharacterized protein LOC129595872 n=1 Tax=Paramacrobiotus metropolitanus TaxID=2943436 RepID=UPI0024461C7E|nr:uncharacterized protein LOC129595872 [Paramacrobiotus metropolitanus]